MGFFGKSLKKQLIDLALSKLKEGNQKNFDTYLNKDCLSSRTCCSHYDMDAREFMSQADRPLPYQPRGACDGIVCDSNLAKKNGMCAIWGASCGTPFIASEFCKKNIQWAEQEKYLLDRPTQPWT